jgi:hypothetical protein
MTTFNSGSHVLAVPCFALAPNRLMLAVVSSPHGFETILTDVATLFQAHLVQPGRALGGRTPGKILLSRVLTATLATSCRTPFVYATLRTEPSLGKGSCKTRRMMVLAVVGTPKDEAICAASAPLVSTPADWSALMSQSVMRA